RHAAARPPVNSTYELVQRFLLIGSDILVMRPSNTPISPQVSKPRPVARAEFVSEMTQPAMSPTIVVAIAGVVLSNPSGSQRPPFQRCAPKIVRSSHAPMLPSGERSPEIG